jgi:hypothetical protein
MALGYMILYNRCVCKPCYDRWLSYMQALDAYTKYAVITGNVALDCSIGDSQACNRLPTDSATLADRQRALIQQAQLLVKACPGAVTFKSP